MKLQSVRDLKAELFEKSAAADPLGGKPQEVELYAAYKRSIPEEFFAPIALGVGKRGDEHVLEIRVQDPEEHTLAKGIAQAASGEANIRFVSVSKRTSPQYFQGDLKTLEPGAQLAMEDKDFVGTLGCIVRDASGKLCILSNSHVLADEGRVGPGWPIRQPHRKSRLVAVLSQYAPFSDATANFIDAAIARLDPMVPAALAFTSARPVVKMIGPVEVTPDMLGAEVFKAGRTTGIRVGKITAVELDNLSVKYDRGILRFNSQIEISGGPATDFSAPGDSGSSIVLEDGRLIGLLFAGGKDSHGEDFTYANRMTLVMKMLGVELAV